ncbi:MAG TPA: hypothetical protein VNN17_01210, partial [Terriglobia bacterium]|nr:hypothetical protein [Terriglobia bacterium]
LLRFLGFTANVRIFCLTSKQRFRLMKFLALALRGQVVFRHSGGESLPLGFGDLLWLWVRGRWCAREERIRSYPIAVLGSASAEPLRRIVQALRAASPGVPIRGFLPAALPDHAAELFDSIIRLRPGLRGWVQDSVRLWGLVRKHQRWIIPGTGEPFTGLKLTAMLWPLRRREIYNEFGDGFRVRAVGTFWRHLRWRRRRNAEARLAPLPIGVIGSASGYYLEKIVPVIRAQFPGVVVHGLLPDTATAATAALFDSVVRLRPGFAGALLQTARLWKARRAFQQWIVPCTNEPYALLKCMAFVWPLRRRQIYNELADGFAARDGRMLYRHLRWRLRDRMSFQMLAGTAGGNVFLRLAHFFLYGLRILGAAPLLLLARARCWRNRWRPVLPVHRHGLARKVGRAGNEKRVAGKNPRGPRGVVASRFPGEPDGSIGID